MGLFEKILKDNESFIKDIDVLDFNYMPKIFLYRENEQHEIAYSIKPLFNNSSGTNLLIYGLSGVGKTLACKRVLEELESNYDDISSIYINSWQSNTEYKIWNSILDSFGKIRSMNKPDKIQKEAIKLLNKKPVVIVIDEVDKLEDFNVLYSFLEQVLKKTIILITNYEDVISKIDSRIFSRLNIKKLEFKPYNKNEMTGILYERLKYAFFNSKSISKDAFDKIVSYTYENKDIRKGLSILKESAIYAESKSLRQIDMTAVETVISNILKSEVTNQKNINEADDLSDETKYVLDLIKNYFSKKNISEIRIGDLHKLCIDSGKDKSYKFIQRVIEKLEKGRFIEVSKVHTATGFTSIIKLKNI